MNHRKLIQSHSDYDASLMQVYLEEQLETTINYRKTYVNYYNSALSPVETKHDNNNNNNKRTSSVSDG